MNPNLASILVDLIQPAKLKEFLADPKAFALSVGLSEIDAMALSSRNLSVIKYQSRIGDLTPEKLAHMDFSSTNGGDPHIEIGPEHEEGGGDEDEVLTPGFALAQSERVQNAPNRDNSLVIVGTGLGAGQLTSEVISQIKSADSLLYCVADAATELTLHRLNPNNEDLYRFYANGKPRRQTYSEMANRIFEVLSSGKSVCAAFYGHPGIFVRPAHAAIDLARRAGYSARMLPAPSSIDCLVADIGVDIAVDGCQIYEATHFVLRNREPDIELVC